MSDNVDNVIFGSGILENMGVAVEIALKSVSVQKLFPLPVSTSGFVADISIADVCRCRAMSAMSYSRRADSKMWGNLWNRFTICFRSKVISTSGFVADI